MKRSRPLSALFFVVWSLIFAAPVTNAQTEWEKIVAAAKREGRVSVIGPQGIEIREALTRGFQKKYPENRVEWSKGAGFAGFRRDVPRDHVPPILVPKDDTDYPQVSSEYYVRLRTEVVAFVRSVMGR